MVSFTINEEKVEEMAIVGDLQTTFFRSGLYAVRYLQGNLKEQRDGWRDVQGIHRKRNQGWDCVLR